MVQKYQNEISPIIYYGISTKINEKDIKIPILQPPDWKSPYWMSLYIHYLQTGGAIVYIAHSCAGPQPTLATNTSNRGHTHSWKLATIFSLRQQHYSFRNFLSSETMDYDVPKKSIYWSFAVTNCRQTPSITLTLRLDKFTDKKKTILKLYRGTLTAAYPLTSSPAPCVWLSRLVTLTLETELTAPPVTSCYNAHTYLHTGTKVQ